MPTWDCSGGLLYRSGRFCEAIDRINEGIAADDGEISPDDTAWLAMAYHESGDHAEACSMLARMTAEEPATSVSRSGPSRRFAYFNARPNASSSIGPSRPIHSHID